MSYIDIDDRPGTTRKACSHGDHLLRLRADGRRACDACPYVDRVSVPVSFTVPSRIATRVVRIMR